jgi:LuxR family maltose regulon positive regulatory protein
MTSDFILVLDDYHVIDTQTVEQALAFLLEHLPPAMHLVIVTREDPQLPLARLRVRGQLTEVRVADLRFTSGEAAQFLNEVMGLNLLPAHVAALETRTEGWIAGLQLAAISMQGHLDLDRFITSFTGSHHFVMDYLVEEVLHQQSDSVQNFLLHTSILDRLCGSLCDAVLLNSSGQETLETIERANLLTVPLDDKREWYRYHHLFADVLRTRLMREQPSQIADLHRRASEWYEQNNLLAEAVHHAFAAHDFERAADLAELAWPDLFKTHFQNTTFLAWVKALPEELVRNRPVLSAGYAWALLDIGELETADIWLCYAEGWVDEPSETPSAEMVVMDEEVFRGLPVSLALARAYIAIAHGDMPATVKYTQRALDLSPETDHYSIASASAMLGLVYLSSGDLDAAYKIITEGMIRLRMSGNIAFSLSGTMILADIRVTQGRFREAIRVYEQALQLAAEYDLQGVADLYMGLSGLFLEQGNLEAAREYLLKSESLGAAMALPDWPTRFCIAQARMQEVEGHLDGALERLNAAERLYYVTPLPDIRPIAALKARIWIAQGRVAEALDWAREKGVSAADDLSYLREFEHITLSRLLIVQYRISPQDTLIQEALTLIERLLKAAEAGRRMRSVIETLVLQALAHEAQDDIHAGLVPLERALTLAQMEGCVRIFVDEGLPMARLLAAAQATEYTHNLLTAIEQPARATQPLIEPLSERELEVLRLIAQGFSNQEISERLFLALSTVKGYNQKIFDKLQVQRRTEAVARARDLGLL